MYRNLEQVLKPYAQREGRIMKLTVVVSLAIGYLVFWSVYNGVTWENDRDLLLLIAGLALCYILSIPLGRLLTRRNIRKQFARFTDAQLRRIDMECADREPLCGIVVTSHALAGEKNLIPIEDIVWVFEKNATQGAIATINELVVVDKNRKQRSVPMSVKAGPFRKVAPEVMEKIMGQLQKYSPGIYCGYHAGLQPYRDDFAGMLAHVEAEYTLLHGR